MQVSIAEVGDMTTWERCDQGAELFMMNVRHSDAGGTMELKDFIRQSLFEISEGIYEANEAYKAARQSRENAFHLWPADGKGDKSRGIDFDVAVTSREEKGAKGGIKVWGVGAGLEGQQAKESVSRIRFTVLLHHFIG